jgi:hypothetical protein
MTVRTSNYTFLNLTFNALPRHKATNEIAHVFHLVPSYVIEFEYQRILLPTVNARRPAENLEHAAPVFQALFARISAAMAGVSRSIRVIVCIAVRTKARLALPVVRAFRARSNAKMAQRQHLPTPIALPHRTYVRNSLASPSWQATSSSLLPRFARTIHKRTAVIIGVRQWPAFHAIIAERAASPWSSTRYCSR